MTNLLELIVSFFAGLMVCMCAARSYISYQEHRIKELSRENLSYQKSEKRLINALRYSGSRIAFYKMMNKSHLAKLQAYSNREAAMRDMLRQPLEIDAKSGR